MIFFEITLQNQSEHAEALESAGMSNAHVSLVLSGGEFKDPAMVEPDLFDTEEETWLEIQKLKNADYSRGMEFIITALIKDFDKDEYIEVVTDRIPAPAPDDES